MKFIQNEIERLEKGLPESEVDGASNNNSFHNNKRRGRGFSGFEYYKSRTWSNRKHRERFQEKYSAGGSSDGPSFFTNSGGRSFNRNSFFTQSR